MQIFTEQGDFPTLLHFAAFHGLNGLATLLLECPGSELALDIQNCHDMTPVELAHLNGHVNLAERLFRHKVEEENKKGEKAKMQPMDSPFSTSEAPRPTASSTPNEKMSQERKCHLLPSSSSTSIYQIPPPPRPVDEDVGKALFTNLHPPYLDMSGASSSGDEGSIAPQSHGQERQPKSTKGMLNT